MRETLHLDNVFRNGPEAIAAMPTSVRKDPFSALGVAVIAVVVPHLSACTPTVESQKPFEATTSQDLSIKEFINNGQPYLYIKLRS